MKIKTLLISGTILLLIFLIYLTTLDKYVYFLPLGDSLAHGTTPYGEKDTSYNEILKKYFSKKNILESFIDNFIEEDYRTTDLIRDINDNKKVIINNKKQSIKNALIKADLVTLSIGMNDLYYKLNSSNLMNEDLYDHVDELINDIDNLFELLRKYCKEDIIITNFYRTTSLMNNDFLNDVFKYANNKLKEKCQKYNIHYVEINEILENNYETLPIPTSFLPSRSGHTAISNELIKIINKSLLN